DQRPRRRRGTGVTAVPTLRQRALLAREGIFNLRDLGGLPVEGGVVAPRRVLRGDALHRAGESVAVLRDLGVVRVLDLRDEVERKEEGVLEAEALEVQHHPVLDPRFPWADDEVEDPSELVAHRYREILTSSSAVANLEPNDVRISPRSSSPTATGRSSRRSAPGSRRRSARSPRWRARTVRPA